MTGNPMSYRRRNRLVHAQSTPVLDEWLSRVLDIVIETVLVRREIVEEVA